MLTPRRKFTDEEKIRILKEAQDENITTILKRYTLSYSVFVKWREKFAENMSNYPPTTMESLKKQVQLLTDENLRLKRIIAEQALQLEVQQEQLRKFATL